MNKVKIKDGYGNDATSSCDDCSRIKELEKQADTWAEDWLKIRRQLKEANEILIAFSGRDGYEKVNQYFTKYKGE